MIGDIFFRVVYWFLNGILNFFPVGGGFPPEAHVAAQTLGGYFQMFSPLIDMQTLTTCVLLAFSVEIAIFGFRTLKWVLSHIPFIGGSG